MSNDKVSHKINISKTQMKQLFITTAFSLLILTNLKAQDDIILGTRISFNPPSGFTNTHHTTFNKGHAFISVHETQGNNYYALIAYLSTNNFNKDLGYHIIESKDLTIDGYPAKYMMKQRDTAFVSMELHFGDSTFTGMISANYPAKDKKLEEEIKQSILSVKYNKDLKVDPFAKSIFSLNDTDTKLKLTISSGFSFMYSINGNKNIDPEKMLVKVYSTPIDFRSSQRKTVEDLIVNLQSHGVKDLIFLSSSNPFINGYKESELHATGTKDGTSVDYFVQSIIHEESQVIITAERTGKALDLQPIRELVNTLKFK